MAKSIAQVRADIRHDIKTNRKQEITGDKLGDRLVDVVDAMSEIEKTVNALMAEAICDGRCPAVVDDTILDSILGLTD